jgi:serine/threonine protein kinase
MQVRDLMRQLLIGVKDIHSQGYIHRDLKPKNLLLEKLNGSTLKLKIADFGLVINKSPEDDFVICGTPGFIAPELFLRHPPSQKSDMFSVGCILYSLLA